MAINVDKIDRGLKTTGEGAEQSAEIAFRVTDDSGGTSLTTERIALSQNGIPERGDQHDDYPDMVASTFTVDPVADGGGSQGWDIVWTYLPEALVPPQPPGDVTPGSAPRARISMSIKTIWVDCWRVPENQVIETLEIPPDGDIPQATGASGDDIGGRAMDSQGTAVSCAVTQVVLDIQQKTIKRAVFETLRSKVGKRNEGIEFGAAIGHLLYLGADMTELDEGGFDYVHHFVWDSNKHARQQVWRDVDGDPAKDTSGSYVDHGFPVYWVQPYPLLISFAGLEINLP